MNFINLIEFNVVVGNIVVGVGFEGEMNFFNLLWIN